MELIFYKITTVIFMILLAVSAREKQRTYSNILYVLSALLLILYFVVHIVLPNL